MSILITCPVCGSSDVKKHIVTEKLSETFGGSVEIDQSEYECMTCGSVGDFGNENEERKELAIQSLKDNTVVSIINDFSGSDVSLSSIERALELPQRTLTKWKNKATSPTAAGVALLKFIKLFPWLLEVAENKYEFSSAQKVHVRVALETILSQMNFLTDVYSQPGSVNTNRSTVLLLHVQQISSETTRTIQGAAEMETSEPSISLTTGGNG